MEKQALAAGNMRLPDLGYNIGVYTFSPSWKEIYPMQKFDRAKLAEAMKQMPAKPSGRTPLVAGLEKLEGVLKGLSGRTVVYLFSDGGYEQAVGKDPATRQRSLPANTTCASWWSATPRTRTASSGSRTWARPMPVRG
jgi:hypothetical protein